MRTPPSQRDHAATTRAMRGRRPKPTLIDAGQLAVGDVVETFLGFSDVTGLEPMDDGFIATTRNGIELLMWEGVKVQVQR